MRDSGLNPHRSPAPAPGATAFVAAVTRDYRYALEVSLSASLDVLMHRQQWPAAWSVVAAVCTYRTAWRKPRLGDWCDLYTVAGVA